MMTAGATAGRPPGRPAETTRRGSCGPRRVRGRRKGVANLHRASAGSPPCWRRCPTWPRGSTGDLSLGMLAALTLGLSLWIAYGLLRREGFVCANAIGTGLAAVVLGCKIRDL